MRQTGKPAAYPGDRSDLFPARKSGLKMSGKITVKMVL
jgi:hypothetical protein